MTPDQKAFLLTLDRDGHLTPDEVVEAARPDDSPIHDCFTWSNEEAGQRYRLNEARSLIRRVRIEYVHHVREIRMPVYVRDPERPANEQGYVKTKLLVTRGEAAMAALQAELDQVAARIERARVIARGLDLEAECERQLIRLVCEPSVVADTDTDATKVQVAS